MKRARVYLGILFGMLIGWLGIAWLTWTVLVLAVGVHGVQSPHRPPFDLRYVAAASR